MRNGAFSAIKILHHVEGLETLLSVMRTTCSAAGAIVKHSTFLSPEHLELFVCGLFLKTLFQFH